MIVIANQTVVCISAEVTPTVDMGLWGLNDCQTALTIAPSLELHCHAGAQRVVNFRYRVRLAK